MSEERVSGGRHRSRAERRMTDDRGVTPFFLGPAEGRALQQVGRVLASGAATGGAFEIVEFSGPHPSPPHVHLARDECFYVVEGTFRFTLGEDEVEAGGGSFVFVPRGTRHGYTMQPGGRALFFIAPAGLEEFFADLGRGLGEGRPVTEVRADLAGRYDTTPA